MKENRVSLCFLGQSQSRVIRTEENATRGKEKGRASNDTFTHLLVPNRKEDTKKRKEETRMRKKEREKPKSRLIILLFFIEGRRKRRGEQGAQTHKLVKQRRRAEKGRGGLRPLSTNFPLYSENRHDEGPVCGKQRGLEKREGKKAY